jgi:hypothetical protein
MSDIFEMKTKVLQLIPLCFGCFHIIGQNTFQDLPVFKQGVVDVPDKTAVVVF